MNKAIIFALLMSGLSVIGLQGMAFSFHSTHMPRLTGDEMQFLEQIVIRISTCDAMQEIAEKEYDPEFDDFLKYQKYWLENSWLPLRRARILCAFRQWRDTYTANTKGELADDKKVKLDKVQRMLCDSILEDLKKPNNKISVAGRIALCVAAGVVVGGLIFVFAGMTTSKRVTTK